MTLSPPSIEETSAKFAVASPPASLISATTCAAGSSSCPLPSGLTPGSFTITRAPSEAASSAVARPIPRPAPVIATTRPSSKFAMVCSYGRRTVAFPGEVLAPSGFSVQISRSTSFSPFSSYLRVTTPLQSMSSSGKSMPR